MVDEEDENEDEEDEEDENEDEDNNVRGVVDWNQRNPRRNSNGLVGDFPDVTMHTMIMMILHVWCRLFVH